MKERRKEEWKREKRQKERRNQNRRKTKDERRKGKDGRGKISGKKRKTKVEERQEENERREKKEERLISFCVFRLYLSAFIGSCSLFFFTVNKKPIIVCIKNRASIRPLSKDIELGFFRSLN